MDWYVWRPWIGFSLGIAIALTTVLLSLSVAGSVQYFAGEAFWPVLWWIALHAPETFVKVLPVAVLVASAVQLTMAYQDGTMTAASAGGVSRVRMLVSWCISLIVLSGISIALSEYVVPPAQRSAAPVWWTAVSQRTAVDRLAGRDLSLPGGWSFEFEAYDVADDRLVGVRVVRYRLGTVDVWHAERARWEGMDLVLEGVRNVRLDLPALDLAGATPIDPRSWARTRDGETVRLSEPRAETVARYADATIGDGRAISRNLHVAADPFGAATERRQAAINAYDAIGSGVGTMVLSLFAVAPMLVRRTTVAGALAWATVFGLQWFLVVAAGRWLALANLVSPAGGTALPFILGAIMAIGFAWYRHVR